MSDQEKLDITTEELGRLKEALKQEEFRKLLTDYAEELADPVKRQQYEDELTMLESQRGVDMKFVKPEPGFVVKLQDSHAKKVFINVCMSPDIAAPEFAYKEQIGEDGKVEQGQQCSLPYSLSPMHQETDNKENLCDVYDVVFNPEVLARCNSTKFKDIVISSAVDGVCNQFNVQLDRSIMKYPKMRFKGTPSQSVIRKRVEQEEEGVFDHLPRRPDFPDLPGEEEQKKTAKKEEKKKADDEPEYKIVFRNDVDLGNFTNDRICSSRPTHITVTISLPLHATTKDVDLDVYPEQLELHSKHYNLLLAFPYTVDSDRGKAKFDKEKKELVVSVDVVPQEIPREILEPAVQASLVEELPEQEDNQSDHSIPISNQSEHSEHTCELEHNHVDHEEIRSCDQKPVQEPPSDVSDTNPSEISEHQSEILSEQQSIISTLAKTPQSEIQTSTDPINDAGLSDINITIQGTTNPGSDTTNPGSDTTNPGSDTTNPGSDTTNPGSETGDGVDTSSDSLQTPPQITAKPNNRFNVSPVLCSRDSCTSADRIDHVCEDPIFINKDVVFPEPDIMDGFIADCGSLTSGLSSYTDTTLEDNLNVSIRVYQDMTTATIILDAVYNSVPVVTISGKKVWLKNEDTVLYLIVPHTITTYTIDMSEDNVCLVMYKQHASLWAALYIGHSEEEVFSFKFITEENADRIVESFGDPWAEEASCTITPHLLSSDNKTEITYSINNRPCSIPIYSPDDTSDDPLIKSILKSPHSPPPMSPRSRKVSFNEEVETFVLPSMRSLKGKKRRKKKSGSNSASESSDDASSPSPTSPLHDAETVFVEPQEYTDLQLTTDSLKLESAGDSNLRRKNGKKSKNVENKENVLQSREEVVQSLDPAGTLGHKLILSNSHIYQLED